MTLETPIMCSLYVEEPGSGGGDGSGGVGIFWLLKCILGVLAIYFLAGSVYRAVWLDKRGIEIIPNHHVWQDLFMILRDFACNLANRLQGGRGGYQQI
jgi:hypothetical protein